VMGAWGDVFLGLDTALEQAGIADRVKVISQSGESAFQNVAAGKEVANIPSPRGYGMWSMIDAGLRALQDMELDPALYEQIPRRYVTQDNNVEDPASETFEPIPDYQEQFLELWGR
jgi:hypothetical protein